ncbi:hypothetical protein AzCIB_2615 [Azoarcus sp. CIB]|uniref:DUF4224 domain-containing protein n=1 Tax=unclassified Azoarcus TaxID=2629479 RepID=UPI0006A2A12F|nr:MULTISPECIES: DUF4224 domain-containing protein [unclassified Azoarcus]AKU12508.1 hypothetical protein AzCIB_2615 [Azoarcus sp. CIB]AYH44533.1 hypothetical protein CDA09_14235 [Azoarcus sp. DN11]
MFLTKDELRNLTGYQKPSLQKRWLTDRGWPYEENAAGDPKVLRSIVEKRMGGSTASTHRRQGPDLGAIL